MNAAKFYPVYIDYVGPNRSSEGPHAEKIRMQPKPARTNSSREERTNGWLGTTDDWSETALGEFDEAGARAILQSHSVRIPDNVPVRYTDYSVISEDYNRKFAYPYDGKPYLIPDTETRWISFPERVQAARMELNDWWMKTYNEKAYTVLVKTSFGWGTVEDALSEDTARNLVQNLPGTWCNPLAL